MRKYAACFELPFRRFLIFVNSVSAYWFCYSGKLAAAHSEPYGKDSWAANLATVNAKREAKKSYHQTRTLCSSTLLLLLPCTFFLLIKILAKNIKGPLSSFQNIKIINWCFNLKSTYFLLFSGPETAFHFPLAIIVIKCKANERQELR